MSYRPTASRPIPTGRRRSPSPSNSTRSGSSQGGSDFGHGRGWGRHTPARSSSGHSSDLIFSMDPERRSNSGSPCLGVAEQPFLYDVPSSWNGRPPDTSTITVCPRCRRQFYEDSLHSHGVTYRSRNGVCPSCRDMDSQQEEQRQRDEEEFYASNSERHNRISTQRPNVYQPQYQVPIPTNGRRPAGTRSTPSSSLQVASCSSRVDSSAHTITTHPFGRPFPSYVAPPPPYPAPPPYTRSVSQPQQAAARWTDVSAHGPVTFVTGSYRPRYQVPQLIIQLEHRAAPPPSISPGTADTFRMTPTSPQPRQWPQS